MRLSSTLSVLAASLYTTQAAALSIPGFPPFWGYQNPYSRWRYSTHREKLTVDLGYEKYEGGTDAATGLNSWKGIRFAAPPTGKNRFQAPKVPTTNRSETLSAKEYASECIQGTGVDSGSEDCLFLNVNAPPNAKNLPVFVFIHGGAYQIGSGALDSLDFIANNNNRFITVFIQYRLGVFGWLASKEFKQHGKLNAGLLDMELALEWVQQYAHVFSGDPNRVTIGGESAGGGAVMLMSMLYGGRIGDRLFDQGIAASPYLPRQFKYDDDVPTTFYNEVLNFTDCGREKGAKARFDCLVELDAVTLSNAGNQVDGIDAMTTRGFSPVTDGELVQDIPSHQLRAGKVNGRRILAGNNANEGTIFTPRGIETSDDFDSYVADYFTDFTARDVDKLKKTYPSRGDTNFTETNYSTEGDKGPDALSISDWANGEQQRVFNLQAEAVLDCPAYWLADSYPGQGWKYEFSMPPAFHSFDTGAYFFSNQTHPDFTDDFVLAFQNIWGNFIVHGDPRISFDLACGQNCTRKPTPESDILRSWVPYSHRSHHPVHLALNVTGGSPAEYNLFGNTASWSVGPGIKNDFRVANADTWEGGRGGRCDFWREVGPRVPG